MFFEKYFLETMSLSSKQFLRYVFFLNIAYYANKLEALYFDNVYSYKISINKIESFVLN